MNRVLKIQQKLLRLPFGARLFSYVVARTAPYFLSISPQVKVLKANYVAATMKKHKAVLNHIQTVHAIASCNLCEFAWRLLYQSIEDGFQ